MLERWPVHSFLIVVFPPVSLYAANADVLSPSSLTRPLTVLLAAAALLFGGFWLVVREPLKAALLATIFVLGFWGWGLFEAVSFEIQNFDTQVWRWFLFSIWCLLGGFLSWRAFKSNSDLRLMTKLLNISAFVLVFAPVANAAVASLAAGSSEKIDIALPSDRLSIPQANPSGDLPDIYYIILDAYGRADALEREGFDIKNGLAKTLPELGFYVAAESESNYPITKFSLASSLNLRYLEELMESGPGDFPPSAVFTEYIQDNAVVRFLRREGYAIVSCSSGVHVTGNLGEDVRIEPRIEFSDFEVMLLDRTPLVLLHGSESFSISPYAFHRRRIETCFDALPELARDPTPTFVMAHVLAPHQPFVFGPNGEELEYPGIKFDFHTRWWHQFGETTEDVINREYVRAYSDQATHISTIVHRAVERVINNSDTPPVIIIQGDHGPGGYLDPQPRRIVFPILNAYYLPNGGDERLYPTISPVNSFRLVFSHYFGADLELLPDKN